MSNLIETSLVKKPHQKQNFSRTQLEEFKKCVESPHYFLSNYFYIQHPVQGKILYKPYDYQIRLIDAYHNHRLVCAMLPRQSGKTITAAGYILWFSMFNKDQNILIAANKFTGASEIMHRIRFGYESMPDWIRAGVVEYNKHSIEFDNGSIIAAHTTTETTGRGKSLSMLYADELAFVRPTVAREFWTSCSLTLSTGGKAIVTSTPNNVDDLFSEIWHNSLKTTDEFGNTNPDGLGKNGFKAISASWDEHPDRDEKWANTQKELIGIEIFSREIECKFIQKEETLINPFKLSKMEGIEPIEKEGQIRWYKKPSKGNTYLVALDPSLGTGGDPAAIQIFEAGSREQIGEWTHNKTPIESQIKLLKEITTYLVSVTENNQDVYYTCENNTLGEACLVTIRNIGEESIPGIFLTESAKVGNARKFRKGFNTTNSTKLSACAILKNMIESDKIKIYSKALISELRNFVSVENTYRAKIGSTDDLVLALLLIIRMIESLKSFLPNLEDFSYKDESLNIPLPFFISMRPFMY